MKRTITIVCIIVFCFFQACSFMTSGSIVDSFVNSFKSGDSTTAWKLLTGDFYNETLAKEEKTQRLNEFQKTWNDKYSDYMARFKHKVKLEKLSSQERL